MVCVSSAILLEFPEEFETERLVIRAPRPGDGEQFNDAIRESIDQLRPWMPWAHEVPPVEQSEENVRKARIRYLERTDLRLHIFDKTSQNFVGSSGLHRIDWTVRKFEIGYWIRSAFAGRGLMTEAVAGIMAFADRELKANRVEIRCDAENERSIALARRLGFTLEGILRHDDLSTAGELCSTMVFAKVRGFEF